MTARQEQRLATENTILATAEQHFVTHGYQNATIRAIAAEANVSTGSVMSVGDKKTLLIRIFDTKIAAIHQSRNGRAGITDAPNPTDAVLATVSPFLTIFAKHLDLSREYFATLVSGSHSSIIFNELAEALEREFAELITHFLPQHADTAASAAHALYLGFLGVLVVWAGSVDATVGDVQLPTTELRRFVDFFFTSQGAHS